MPIEKILANGSDDTRVRVLWIEDNKRLIPGVWDDWQQWFTVTTVKSISDLETIFSSSDYTGFSNNETGKRSSFDIYLTDFRLCDDKDECQEKEHIDSGIHAPAAGFMAGLMAALRFPGHIQCIVPYSAFDEEFGPLWTLISRLCPPTVTVEWENHPTKAELDQDFLRKAASRTFRLAIESACKRRLSYITFASRSNLEKSIQAGPPDVSASLRIEFASGDAVRSVQLGSIFNDQLVGSATGGTIPTAVISEWLNGIPTVDPLEIRARSIAELYWLLRFRPYSRLRYALFHESRVPDHAVIGDLDEGIFIVPWLGKFVSDTCRGMDEKAVLRLATLFLILREETYKEAARRPNSPQRVSKIAAHILEHWSNPDHLTEATLKIAEYDNDPGFISRMTDILAKIEDVVESEEEDRPSGVEGHELINAYGPLGEPELCQLLDPLPEKISTIGWDKDKKIGKALSRANLNIVRLVGADDSGELSPTELTAARRYALEQGLQRGNWPNWLRSNH